MAKELQRRGWRETDLSTRRRSHPGKLEVAAQLRRETTLTLKAIAARVHLGTSNAGNATLHRYMRQGEQHNKRRGRQSK